MKLAWIMAAEMAVAISAASGYSAEIQTRTEGNIPYAKHPACRLAVRYPVGIANFQTVVWFHGGGLDAGRRHFIALSDDAIAQVAVDYRLLGKDAEKGEDCIDDAAAAVAWVLANIARYGGDQHRVFVAGLSAGGYLAMMVGMDSSRLAAHGASNSDIAGIVSISGQATKHYNVRSYSGDKTPQFVPKIDGLAPLAYVSADIPPILCICGQPPHEFKCRAEENRLLIASCSAHGHPFARYVECQLCDHNRVCDAALPYLDMFVKGKLP